MDPLVEQIRGVYPRAAGQLLPLLLDLMVKARDACDGDIESFIIALAVAQRSIDQPAFRALTYEQLQAGFDKALLGRGTNIRSIADSTGIPKETVRRKVTGLEEAGVLLRRGRLLYCAPTGFAAFLTVREALLKLVARGCRLADEIQDARAPVVG